MASTDSVHEAVQIPRSRKTTLISQTISYKISVLPSSVNLSSKLVTVASLVLPESRLGLMFGL